MNDKMRMPWEVERVFSDNELVVEVSRLKVHGRPRFSLSIGWKRADGSVRRGIPVTTTGQGKVFLDEGSNLLDVRLTSLLQQAQRYISAKAQEIEDAFWASKRNHEERSVHKPAGKKRYEGHREHGDDGLVRMFNGKKGKNHRQAES